MICTTLYGGTVEIRACRRYEHTSAEFAKADATGESSDFVSNSRPVSHDDLETRVFSFFVGIELVDSIQYSTEY